MAIGLKNKETKYEATAYLLLSGGQDSFACLLWARERFARLEAIGIEYGQRHAIEVQYAKKMTEKFSVSYVCYPLDDFLSRMADSSLFTGGSHHTPHRQASTLPASFVPNRNGLFLTIAASHAFRKGEAHIHLITGVCQTDYSGYPDCRHAYIKAKERELALGLDKPVSIHTPLMYKTKAETFAMAEKAGYLKEMIEDTLSCYNGQETLHPWGRGCGECPACRLRKKGYEEFMKGKQ